jgi:hypothetical protein
VRGQDSTGVDRELYRFTLGSGIGSGYPLQDGDVGFGGSIGFAFQKHNDVYALDARVLGELQIFDYSKVNNSISSVELNYGRGFKKNSFFSCVSAGIGWVTSVQKGKLLSRQGDWFSSVSSYEKITHHTIGFPISVKAFWVPLKFYGLGIELFININSIKTFYGINLCHQFGKLKAKKDK